MRNHQIAKHNPHFRLQQHILRKQFFSRQEKAKAVEGKKNIHITNRITKFLVPSFNKCPRNEISTRYQQCRRQTKGSERALAENGGHYKMDRTFTRKNWYFKATILYSSLKKDTYKPSSVYYLVSHAACIIA